MLANISAWPAVGLSDVSSANDDLACQELVELVTDYLEDRLTTPERLRFEAHLGICPGCHTYLEQMRQTLRAMGRLSGESIEPEAKQRLLQVFRDWNPGTLSREEGEQNRGRG
jgi:hypothetical protein